MLKSYLKYAGMLVVLILLTSFKSIPDKAKAVTNFDVKKYMGKWYEIARLDFKFERDLNNTTAEYSLYDNGCVKVINRGYNYKKDKWKQAKGKAKFCGPTNVGELKVSFFGPFYSGYNVIAVDDNYKYALVAGKNLDYLWILSREKTIPNSVRESYLKLAEDIGYTTSDLVWVEHDN